MFANIYIRKSLTIVLLAIFALCNTPTKYLHELFANHTDFVSKTLNDSNSPQLNAPGIDCHCYTNVVMAPYTFTATPVISHTPVVFIELPFYTATRLISLEADHIGLRGPPAIC